VRGSTKKPRQARPPAGGASFKIRWGPTPQRSDDRIGRPTHCNLGRVSHSPCDDHHRMVDCILLLVRRGRVRSLPLDCCNHCACLVSRWIAAISNGGSRLPNCGSHFGNWELRRRSDINSTSPPCPCRVPVCAGTQIGKKKCRKPKRNARLRPTTTALGGGACACSSLARPR